MKKDEVRKATDKILNGLEKDFKKAYQKAYFNASIYFKKKLATIKAGLKGIEDETPIFKRNVMANESEIVNMVMLESQVLDTETVLKKLPNISPEEIPEIMAKKALEDKWTPSDEEEMVNEEG